MTVPSFVRDDLAALQLEISDEELSQLARYLELLLEANTRVNLTGIRDWDEAWRRHILDSLTLLVAMSDLPRSSRVIDVGSGGGLPGLPLAIVLPQHRFTLLEATGKKAEFLKSCAATLGLSHVVVVNHRAEKLGQLKPYRERFDLAVSRALGPMREMLEYTLPLVRVGGFTLAMKGPSVEDELAQASDAMDTLGGGELCVLDAYPESMDNRSVIVRIAKERETPAAYPRLPGVPRQTPL